MLFLEKLDLFLLYMCWTESSRKALQRFLQQVKKLQQLTVLLPVRKVLTPVLEGVSPAVLKRVTPAVLERVA